MREAADSVLRRAEAYVREHWSRLTSRGGNASSRTLTSPTAPLPTNATDPAPVEIHSEHADETFYAIGDIHGRADLIVSLVDKIEEDIAGSDAKVRLIFLGDYCDRGLETRQVIDFLLSERVQKHRPIFIKGNHEQTLIEFLSDPATGPAWARYGGRETLVSYGVRPPRSLSFNEDWERARLEFREKLPQSHETFLLSLKPSARIGKYGFVHAGMKPGVPFDEQRERDLLWIRDEFLTSSETFDVFLVHGHTPVDQATNSNSRVNVDTGAYYSGRLTAARIAGDDISFISTRA